MGTDTRRRMCVRCRASLYHREVVWKDVKTGTGDAARLPYCHVCTVIDQEKGVTKKQGNRGGTKKEIDGILFDSTAEAEYYSSLVIRKAAGEIRGFRRQVEFELQPEFKDSAGKKRSAWRYTVDFVIQYNDGTEEAVEVKGYPNERWPLVMKRFLYKFPEYKFTVVGGGKKKRKTKKGNKPTAGQSSR